MALTDAQIRKAQPAAKPFKIPDGDGLHLLVRRNGAKLWRFRYYRPRSGAENMLSFGAYPETSLKLARQKRDDARRKLAAGLDPSAERRAEREAANDTFELVAKEWLAQRSPHAKPDGRSKVKRFSKATYEKAEWLLGLVGNLATMPVRDITAADVLRQLRKIEARGKHETCHRVKQRISQVMRYAVASGRADADPTLSIRDALAPVETQHHAAVTNPAEVGALLRAIDDYQGQPAVVYAMRLAPHLFVRPGELRRAEWSEFELDGDEPTWRIPAEKMKMPERHVVPLSTQAVAIIRELAQIETGSKYLFPSLRSKDRPLSENGVTAALRRMGYTGEQMTWHGFRTIASTLLNELGHNGDLIELQLAHKERNQVRAAYNRAERLKERRAMMQSWSDYLDQLKDAKSNVVPIKKGRRA
jgi:integrase